jgi:DNA topoisomerase I
MRGINARMNAEEAIEAAHEAGLRYSSDTEPGIRRVRRGSGFRYVAPGGRAASARDLDRIRALAIPPAYKDVWICADPRGHLQATGRDARGRKQYRYHPDWAAARDDSKFHRVADFGKALPRIHKHVKENLARPGIPRDKVLATVVYLLENVLIRVGNDEYARENDSYGLTTLKDQHVQLKGDTVRFRFMGKSGVHHDVDIRDRRVAKVIRTCQHLPGQRLFEYVDDDGAVRHVSSHDVNDYIRSAASEEFSAKDFRTWGGTVTCCRLLVREEPARSASDGKRRVNAVIKIVAARLGNTVAVCRKAYIHPAILAAYLDGSLPRAGKAEQIILRLLSAQSKRK